MTPDSNTIQAPRVEAQTASLLFPAHPKLQRPTVRGKFLYVGDEKWYLRGVTYGTFRPRGPLQEEYSPNQVEADFDLMARNGINAVRTYTVPPRWLLDAAQRHGLRVMIGLPWEQHITFLDDPRRAADIEKRLRGEIAACAGHPALLCYSIGNEIPAPIVRWHGRRPVERFLERLYLAAKGEDPGALVTYVNYPTTEYLQLPFIDLFCFNVYLESEATLDAYLARLQNIAGERPLIMAEIGLDSRRNGEEGQAATLDWQVRTAFAAGCAGTFVFSWTDEWHRGGHDIEDWDFGLTTRARRPKRALAAVRKAFAEVPFSSDLSGPLISVVVCSYNGAKTIRDCFEGLMRLDYPNYEVIVVDDGSTDETAAIAKEYGFQLIQTENRGLGSARNSGLAAARGEIVAYIDDDAYPDPHWLTYLAAMFIRTSHVGVGGPNLPPPDDGPIADCVANAPGGPIHVLLSDQEAEHIPGCNMAFRRSALLAIGGCDPQFRAAGDDVDLCWRLQQRGGTLGFSPAAMVWHHRRNSIVRYWKQQQGYGKAEALLSEKWPEKYNAAGHLTWSGRLYGKGWTQPLGWGARIYHGTWGSALFQSLYEPHPTTLASLPLMPEWYLLLLFLGGLSLLSPLWKPLWTAVPLFLLALVIPAIQSWLSARRAVFHGAPRGKRLLKLQVITALLHLIQPLSRLIGRLRHGLSPWRGPSGGKQSGPLPQNRWTLPLPRNATVWSESWLSPECRLGSLQSILKEKWGKYTEPYLQCGGDFDPWDLQLRGGLLGATRLQMVIEEHGGGKQLIRFKAWPRITRGGGLLLILLFTLCAAAIFDHAWLPSAIFGAGALFLIGRAVQECNEGLSSLLGAIDRTQGERKG